LFEDDTEAAKTLAGRLMGSAQLEKPFDPDQPANPLNSGIKSGRELELALDMSKKLIAAVQKVKKFQEDMKLEEDKKKIDLQMAELLKTSQAERLAQEKLARLSEPRSAERSNCRPVQERSGFQTEPEFLPRPGRHLPDFVRSGGMMDPFYAENYQDQTRMLPDSNRDKISPNFNIRKQMASNSAKDINLPTKERELFPSAQNIQPDLYRRSLPEFNNPFSLSASHQTNWEPNAREDLKSSFGTESWEQSSRISGMPDRSLNSSFGTKSYRESDWELMSERLEKVPPKVGISSSREQNWEESNRRSNLPYSREGTNKQFSLSSSHDSNWEESNRSSSLPYSSRKPDLSDSSAKILPNFQNQFAIPPSSHVETNWEQNQQMSRRSVFPDSREKVFNKPFGVSPSSLETNWEQMSRTGNDQHRSPDFTIPLKINFPSKDQRQDLDDWKRMPGNFNQNNFPKLAGNQTHIQNTGQNFPEIRNFPHSKISNPDLSRTSKLSDHLQGNQQHKERVLDDFQDWTSPNFNNPSRVNQNKVNQRQNKVSSSNVPKTQIRNEIKVIPGTFSEQLYAQSKSQEKNFFESDRNLAGPSSSNGNTSQGHNDVLLKAKAKLMAKRIKTEEPNCQIGFDNFAHQANPAYPGNPAYPANPGYLTNPSSNQDLVNSLDWEGLSKLLASNAAKNKPY